MTMLNTECKKESADNFVANNQAQLTARDYSNNDLVRLIKKNNPPLTDKELTAVLIAASPLDDHIIKEVLKRGQPPANAAISDETLQLILLRNLPLSDHIQKEAKKYRGGHVFDRNLIDNLLVAEIPDMKLSDATFIIEAGLNLKYGDAHAAFDSIEPIKHTFQVPGKFYSEQYFLMAHDFISAMDSMRLQCEQDEAGGCSCFSKKIRGIDLNVTTATEPATADKTFYIDLTVFLAVQTVDMEQFLSINEFCEPDNVQYSFSITYDCVYQNTTYPTCSSWMNYIMSSPIQHESQCQTLFACGDFFTDFQPWHLINNDGSLCQYFINTYYNNWQGHNFCISPQELSSKFLSTFSIINSPQHKPEGYIPAIILNKPMPGNAFCSGNHFYYDAEVKYARCGQIF